MTEDPSLSKASKGSQGFLRLQEGPRDPERPRKVQGVRGSKGKQEGVRGLRGAREARPLSLTEDPSLLKACKGSQGFLRPQEGPRSPEKYREAQGARGSEME